MRILGLQLDILLEDGTTVHGHIHHNGDNQRWGASQPHLGACVVPMEAIEAALTENDSWYREPEALPDEGAEPDD